MVKQTSFRNFYVQNYGSIFRFVRSILKSELEAEDTVQESFFRLYKVWASLESDDHARAWIFSVARNLAIDELKTKKNYHKKLITEYESEYKLLEELAMQEATRMLESAITKLPPQTGRIILLAYTGKSNQQIADELGVSQNSVKTLKKEGYKKLRTMLGEDYNMLIICALLNSFIFP